LFLIVCVVGHAQLTVFVAIIRKSNRGSPGHRMTCVVAGEIASSPCGAASSEAAHVTLVSNIRTHRVVHTVSLGRITRSRLSTKSPILVSWCFQLFFRSFLLPFHKKGKNQSTFFVPLH
jgi:hypothetical protein